MNVRFRKQYSDSEPRMAYELVSDEFIFDWNETGQYWCDNYNTKLLGLVPIHKMGITNDETDGEN